jgi:hypothetical protein
MPWAQAIQAKVCTITSTADSSRIAHRSRAMSFSMHLVGVLHYRASRFGIVFDGGPGVGGNGGRPSWRRATGSSKTFSISRNGHQSKKRSSREM